MLTSEGGLLNGRLRYVQPVDGFRSGLEPVLLAASVPLRGGDRVLEGGTGAGAGLLCLHARSQDLASIGVELDAGMAALAAANAATNGFGSMTIITGDIRSVGVAGPFDHAIANPPYHPPGTPSPLAVKERARRGGNDLIRSWVMRLASLLRRHGTLTMALRSQAVPACITAMEAACCPCTVLFPFWPAAGRAAKLVLVRGVKESRTPMRLAAGLVLHEADGTFTDRAQAILRHGAALPIE